MGRRVDERRTRWLGVELGSTRKRLPDRVKDLLKAALAAGSFGVAEGRTGSACASRPDGGERALLRALDTEGVRHGVAWTV